MSIPGFFIRRPIFASVIAIVIVIAGLAAAQVLPVSEYPQISPPTVTIAASYRGASAETVARTVAAPIEEQLHGIEGLTYFSTSASGNGTVNITVTFDVGTDIDAAAVDVNNRVKAAEPRLPEEVRRDGVQIRERSGNMLMLLGLYSPDGTRDRLFLSNYASLNVIDELKRVRGVGDASLFGSLNYAMRIWLKPDRMAQLGITTSDIAAAIRAQNEQNAAGKIGQDPVPDDQMLVYTVTAKGRLLTPEQFGDIILRAGGPQGVLRLRDVARIELGGSSYDVTTLENGRPVVGMGIFLQSGANALEVAGEVRRTVDELKKSLPAGVDTVVAVDTTEFISASISEVVQTLLEAALLVAAVIYLFLHSLRATLIPMIAVPVALIGTLAGLWLFGFTLNTLTLFAMVLAIGIVVDDAIIVLENVERLMSEERLSPFDAAVEAMREVSGAVVAIVLVLCAVFVPVAFLGGMAGALYEQFAVTVAVAVVISGIVALTLTPALCALILRPPHDEARPFRAFNHGFARLTRGYTRLVTHILHHPWLGAAVFIGVVALVLLMLRIVPRSFVPAEDQGYVIASLTLPDGASLARTIESGERFRAMISGNEAIERVFFGAGMDLLGGGNRSSAGTLFVNFTDWSEREASADSIAAELTRIGMTLPDGQVMSFNPPAISGLGTVGGFELYLQDRTEGDPQRLYEVVQSFMADLRQRPELTGINSFFRPSVPQLFVEVDEPKALSLGVPLPAIYETLQSTMGVLYVNDFNRAGRTYRVQLQAESQYRRKPDDLGRLYVRSATSRAMIPLAALIRVRDTVGPEQLERFNGFLAARIGGTAAAGISSGEAIRIVEETARAALPAGYQIAWTGQAFQERRASGSSALALAFGVIMVFLILAAQYERWSLPLAIIMAVPFALLGALVLVLARGMSNDIYFQIGLVVLIGLASKNAILIVEFAAQKHADGMGVIEAAIEAARLRFRPIVMTSLAFMLSVTLLAVASGPGAAGRRSMGTGVFGGMLFASTIAILFVPLFFKWLERGKAAARDTARPALDRPHAGD